MKNLKPTIGLILLGVIFSALISFTMLQTKEIDIIVGTWKPKGSPNNSWVFTSDGKCYQYSATDVTDVYNYSISTTSPQCGYAVNVGPNFSYLKLINVNNAEDIYCYEITTLNNEFLALIYLGGASYQPSVFKRQ